MRAVYDHQCDVIHRYCNSSSSSFLLHNAEKNLKWDARKSLINNGIKKRIIPFQKTYMLDYTSQCSSWRLLRDITGEEVRESRSYKSGIILLLKKIITTYMFISPRCFSKQLVIHGR